MLEKLPEGVGHALIHQRAGADQLVCNRFQAQGEAPSIVVASDAFRAGGALPISCTADGTGLSPALKWQNIPADAESIALIVEDADSPTPRPLVHAIVTGLPVHIDGLPEAALNHGEHDGLKMALGRNSYFKRAWLPPDPPPGHGAHRYVFQLFALGRADKSLPEGPGRREFIELVMDRAIASGTLTGTYERGDRGPAP